VRAVEADTVKLFVRPTLRMRPLLRALELSNYWRVMYAFCKEIGERYDKVLGCAAQSCTANSDRRSTTPGTSRCLSPPKPIPPSYIFDSEIPQPDAPLHFRARLREKALHVSATCLGYDARGRASIILSQLTPNSPACTPAVAAGPDGVHEQCGRRQRWAAQRHQQLVLVRRPPALGLPSLTGVSAFHASLDCYFCETFGVRERITHISPR